MPDTDNRHVKLGTVYIINDTIITNANSVCMFRTYELLQPDDLGSSAKASIAETILGSH